MFWRFGGYATVSAIDNLLEKPDVTLEELLDESDLIQELKQHNTKLIEYLREDKILERLLEYVVAPKLEVVASEAPEAAEEKEKEKDSEKGKGRSFSKPREAPEGDEDEKEKKRNRYAYVAAEVLSSDNWSICESLMENQALLRKFWEFLRLPPPLDPLQASYFTKVNEALLDKKTEEMLDLFKSIDGAVKNMLQHVDSPMVMDLLLKIISLEKAEGGQGIVDVYFTTTKHVCIANAIPVAPFPRPHADTTFLLVIRTLVGDADFRWRLLKGYNYHFRKRITKRAIVHWSKRADKTTCIKAMH
jgi:SIT4-associating protein SAP185/190